MAIELDYMEVATDALMQARYVTNAGCSTYGSGVFTGGTPTSDTAIEPELGFDKDSATHYNSGADAYPHWLKYDLGSGITKILNKYTVQARASFGETAPRDFKFQGSNNDSTWTDLDTQVDQVFSNGELKTYTFVNVTAYRYYRILGTENSSGGFPNYMQIAELEGMEGVHYLQSYSEATIKTQGSYALKGVAAITDSLNKTLTRTIGSPIDLTGQTQIKFDIRSSRTGGNIKIGIYDATVPTTTEKTYTVLSADTWETVTWDISAVTDANKNAISKIIVTILNADAANTFYVDNMFSSLASTKIFNDDTITLSEVVQKKAFKIKLETVTLSEIVVKASGKRFLETATLSETYSRHFTLHWLFTEIVTLTETFGIYRIYFKLFTETVNLTETFARRMTKAWLDTVTLTEVFKRSMAKRWLEIITLTEVAQKQVSLFISEVVTLSEKFIRGRSRIFLEVVTLTEVFRKRISKAFLEIVTLTCVFRRGFLKLFTEQITLSDLLRYWKSIRPKSSTWTKTTPKSGSWPKEWMGGGAWTEKQS